MAFIDPNDGSVFCEKREKVIRSYRLNGQEAGDFTAYNQKTLEVLLTRLEKSFQRPLSAWMREQSSKKPEISEKPSLWSFSQTPKEETQASAGPVPDSKISKSRAALPERKQDESSEAEEIIAESIPLTDAKMVSRKAVLEKKVPAPNLSESEGNVQNNLLDRGFQELEMPREAPHPQGSSIWNFRDINYCIRLPLIKTRSMRLIILSPQVASLRLTMKQLLRCLPRSIPWPLKSLCLIIFKASSLLL